MKPAPGKPGLTPAVNIIPAASLHARQITPRIRTSEPGWKADWVKAEYTRVDEYDNPYDAPLFARMSAPAPHHGKHKWTAEVVVQCFGRDEPEALNMLLNALEQMGLPDEPEAVRVAAAFENTAWCDLPWACQPLGLRGSKPKPARVKLTTHTGKQKQFYRDTGKPHRDPNCPCVYCAPPPPQEDEEDTTTP